MSMATCVWCVENVLVECVLFEREEREKGPVKMASVYRLYGNTQLGETCRLGLKREYDVQVCVR